MNISKYEAFFHDGSVLGIAHRGAAINFCLASAEMDEEDVKDDVTLSNDNSIRGILHVEGIKNILINEKRFSGIMKQKYDDGTIFNLEITKNEIELSVDWANFPPKPEVNDFSVIKIKADRIWWENIPNLDTAV